MKKKLLATILAAVLAVGLLPGTVWAAGSDFVIENGVLTKYNGSGGKVTIPNSVTAISAEAFYRCTSLTSVTIPVSITNIGFNAFYDCYSLTDVYYGGSEAQWGMIMSYQALGPMPGAVALANGGQYAAGLDGVTVHYNSAAEPEESEKPDSNTGFIITDGVLWLYMGPGGDITIPSNVTSIDGGFFGNTSLTSVTIPGNVTSIGDSVFYGCSNLTSVTMLSGVTTIGDAAFAGCSSLTSVTIPGSVAAIGASEFKNCTGLTSVTILDGVTAIGAGAFWSCESLTSITIPKSVTTIGEGAFVFCESLASVTVPSSVTAIGAGAFDFCDSLTDIYYGGSESQWKQIFNENDYVQPLTDVTIHYNSTGPAAPSFPDVPDWGVTEVNWGADKGIVKGVGGGLFGSNNTCTHAEILTFLWRAAGEPTAKPSSFTVETYFQSAVDWAYETGMIDGSFVSAAPCTRASAVKYIWQARGSESAPASSFPDVLSNADYAHAVDWAVANGVTKGTGDGSVFSPDKTCTRVEIVTMLYRAYAD